MLPKCQPDLIATLRRVPLFTDLSEDELSIVAQRVISREYEAGVILFLEGDVCRELLIVKEGRVKLLKTSPNGRQQLIGMERAGNSLSEVPVFDGDTHATTAKAASPVVLLCIDAEHFRGICLRHPKVALKVIKVLGHRLRRMGELVEHLSFSTVRGRLVAYLVHLAEESGRPSDTGIIFELHENNEELAARLGTVRELVSRNLGRLYSDGLIHMKRRTVTIPSLTALKKEIET